MDSQLKIAVIVPAYKVRKHILGVLGSIGSNAALIVVVDDACPEHSGRLVTESSSDPRVLVVTHQVNQGVGGAVMSGYRAAIAAGADIMVKIDGDGQMDPALIEDFVHPIAAGEADYTKGNRFFDLENIRRMPKVRIFGNAVLSFMAKLSTGYWDLFDPTNGYTAIHRSVIEDLPLDRVSKRYFFETDLLFRLGTIRAKVVDVPMEAFYGDEVSNLKISRILGEFLRKHTTNFIKRIFYNYFLRGMSIASLELLLGLIIFIFGICFGAYHWTRSLVSDVTATTGTVMVASLSVLMGLQLLLAFMSFDFASVPRHARHPHKRTRKRKSTTY